MKHTLRSISLLLCSFFFYTTASACSCAEFPPFCEEAIAHPKVLTEIVGHDYGFIDGQARVFYTNVKILVNLSSETFADTISMINQDGLNCNGSIFEFPVGDSVIISIPYEEVDLADWPDIVENAPVHTTFDLAGCGLFHLGVKDGLIGGGAMELVELERFLANPSGNCPTLVDVTEPNTLTAVTVAPNPVDELLRVSNNSPEDLQLVLINTKGQLQLSFELKANAAIDLPVPDLPSGSYILRQKALTGEHSILIMKH
jgi:hypothetical protein